VGAGLLWDSAGMSAPPAAAPTGVVTFLFTNVEGSTRRREQDADGMRIALAAHDDVLGSAIEAHGGWLFKRCCRHWPNSLGRLASHVNANSIRQAQLI